MTYDPMDTIQHYYPPQSKAYTILVDHGRAVARKALTVADRVAHLGPDRDFIHEAAMLHDIGMFMTAAPQIGCTGDQPYVCHGFLGGQLLAAAGLGCHARVCESHVGLGLTVDDIRKQRLPLPHRDMRPITLEEQIVCYADKFFSKSANGDGREKSIAQVLVSLARHGEDKPALFLRWAQFFGEH